MPVQIGAKAHSFSDPTGLLYDCHRLAKYCSNSPKVLQFSAVELLRPSLCFARM